MRRARWREPRVSSKRSGLIHARVDAQLSFSLYVPCVTTVVTAQLESHIENDVISSIFLELKTSWQRLSNVWRG